MLFIHSAPAIYACSWIWFGLNVRFFSFCYVWVTKFMHFICSKMTKWWHSTVLFGFGHFVQCTATHIHLAMTSFIIVFIVFSVVYGIRLDRFEFFLYNDDSAFFWFHLQHNTDNLVVFYSSSFYFLWPPSINIIILRCLPFAMESGLRFSLVVGFCWLYVLFVQNWNGMYNIWISSRVFLRNVCMFFFLCFLSIHW